MKVNIRDPQVFRELNYRDVHAYLLARGWLLVEQIDDRAYCLTKDDDERRAWEVVVPARTNVSDYTIRMSEVVATLAEVENRSELSIISDLSMAGVDVVRVRAPFVEAEGTITLENGVTLHEQARLMLLAAACSAYDPRPTYHAGKVSEAVSYLQAVRLGQTERGSYVVTLLSPVDPALSGRQVALAPEFEAEPFSRRVTLRLAEGLVQLSRAITASDGADGFTAFERSVRHGVSANLCDAVAGLIDSGGGTSVELSWARTRPTPKLTSRTEFGRDMAGVLREASREFRKREPQPDVSLSGWVVQLAREPDQFDGDATVRALLNNESRPRHIRVKFDQADFGAVLRAFEQKLAISLEGDLAQVGQRWELRRPRSVRAIAPAED